MTRKITNSTRNNPARNFAIANDAPAMLVNPSTAAIKPITRNTNAMWSMSNLPQPRVVAKPVPGDIG